MNDKYTPIPHLDSDWHPQKGLYYPISLSFADGTSQIFKNYEEHHNFIHDLFLARN